VNVCDVEPDDVAPVAATHSVSESTPVRSSVAGKPGSMAAEPAGPVSAPSSPLQRESFRGRTRNTRACGFSSGGERYSSGQEAGPIELDTQFKGQTMLSSPDIETSTSLVLSGSGVPGPDAGVGIPAAAAAAGERPSPATRRRSQSLQPHATAAAGYLTILISTTWTR